MAALLAIVAILLVVCLLPSAFLAWLLMLALGALGLPVPFLPCWAITFVACTIFGSSRIEVYER